MGHKVGLSEPERVVWIVYAWIRGKRGGYKKGSTQLVQERTLSPQNAEVS